MVKAKKETVDEVDDAPAGITGDGTPRLRVRANVAWGGLEAGQTGFVPETDEVYACIDTGVLDWGSEE